MKRIHIIGQKNSGKTTLVVELVQACKQLGYRVGTIKHTHHQHELDTPGKDSHQHREAGSDVVGILTQKMNAVFIPTPESSELTREQRYDRLAPMYADCDLVIVEGDSLTKQPKIEVWRNALGSAPQSTNDASVSAIVTDDPLEATIPIWPRSDTATLAKNLVSLLQV